MSIIVEGNGYHIEYHAVTVSVGDGVSFNSSNVPLDRPGTFIGGSISLGSGAANDNVEAMGGLFLLDQGAGIITFGEDITGIVVGVRKQSGTAGANDVVFHAVVYIRDKRNL